MLLRLSDHDLTLQMRAITVCLDCSSTLSLSASFDIIAYLNLDVRNYVKKYLN